MANPLETGGMFMFEIMNPNPSSRKTKDGPKYLLNCEIEKDVHELFMMSETAGMVLELQGRVIAKNDPLPDKPKGGRVSIRAARLCREAGFDEWSHNKLHELGIDDNSPLTDGVRLIYYTCGIKSRAELDHNDVAKEKFLTLSNQFYFNK